ncbi:MAG: DUF2189 domain-containing protein [Pseudomonadota bacterium]|nr:DUF2189 domain-containing protein [Pseudomonadota bacterium]
MKDTTAFPTPRPTIDADAPWQWLAAGWRDMRQAPVASLLYGVIAAIISVLLISALIGFDMGYLVLPLTAGFMLVGPFLAVGLYDISWRLETGDPHGLLPAVRRRGAGPTQLALVGLLLMLILLAWWRLAMLIYALFFGLAPFPGLAESVNLLFFTADGLTMLAVGTAVGGVIACAVFAAAAFSIPMLLARYIDAISAIIASVGGDEPVKPGGGGDRRQHAIDRLFPAIASRGTAPSTWLHGGHFGALFRPLVTARAAPLGSKHGVWQISR